MQRLRTAAISHHNCGVEFEALKQQLKAVKHYNQGAALVAQYGLGEQLGTAIHEAAISAEQEMKVPVIVFYLCAVVVCLWRSLAP